MMCMLTHAVGHSEHAPNVSQPAGSATDRGSLLNILERRYALGEINTAQLLEMKRVLGLTDTAPTAVSGPEHARR